MLQLLIIFSFLGLLCTWFVPETRGRTLEELSNEGEHQKPAAKDSQDNNKEQKYTFQQDTPAGAQAAVWVSALMLCLWALYSRGTGLSISLILSYHYSYKQIMYSKFFASVEGLTV